MSRAIDSFSGEYSWLSNFYPVRIEIVGDHTYPTVEHAFQAGKTNDPEERAWVALAERPGQAKARGQRVTLRSDWEQFRIQFMAGLLNLKFADPVLRVKLVATGDALLIEGNTWCDQYWGSCNCPKHVDVPGKNNLGVLLMALRDILIYTEES